MVPTNRLPFGSSLVYLDPLYFSARRQYSLRAGFMDP